jgi:hypothetical protein
VEGGEKENKGRLKMPRRRGTDWSILLSAVIVVFGIILFLYGQQIAVQTKTNLNYSALGAFMFLAGMLIFLATRPKGRRR